jgi:tetratricopeptide (TPR) repeat protein
LGSALSRTGGKPEAEALYRKSIVLLEKLVAEFPDERHYHSQLGRVLNDLAESLRERDQLSEARALIKRAIEEQEIACYRFGETRARHVKLLQGHLNELASIFLRGHDHASAVKVASDLVGRFPDSGDAYYNAGCILSRSIPLAENDRELSESKRAETARSYTDRALAELKVAVAKGFTKAENMKKDPDLDPLRSRMEFQKLVAEVERLEKTASSARGKGM